MIDSSLFKQTPSLAPMASSLAVAASHDVTVLVTGETGTGKTFLARLIHDLSSRKQHPFVVVPCGALTRSLVESELFGHVRGAFTGADRVKVGRLEAAAAGTVLLDEIDTLGLDQQAKLLRVIETGEFEPVGSNDTLHCRARFIAASNRDLEEAVEQRTFRQDLYYRLNVLSLHLPPLCKRVRDIMPLVNAMVGRFSQKFAKTVTTVHPQTIALLTRFPWPGNIRQLENAIQYAVLYCSGRELLPVHLPAHVRTHVADPHTLPEVVGDSLRHKTGANEREYIKRVLHSCGYSRTRTAKALGVSRVTMYNKLKKYGLEDIHLSMAAAS